MIAPPLPELPDPAPLHQVQYVIEIVGPRSMTASEARVLLDPAWQRALGQPEAYVMGPADTRWRTLVADDPTGSYDSLAWDLIGRHGSLHGESAARLLAALEPLATNLQRRAMPLPVPAEIDARVAGLVEIVAALDIGIEAVLVFPGAGVEDAALAAWGAKQGLSCTPDGLEWRVPGWDEPLFELSRALDDPPVSPSASSMRQTMSIGFSLPRCPAPGPVLDAMVQTTEQCGVRFGAACVINDTVQHPSILQALLPQALGLFESAGIRPGSPEARNLFRL